MLLQFSLGVASKKAARVGLALRSGDVLIREEGRQSMLVFRSLPIEARSEVESVFRLGSLREEESGIGETAACRKALGAGCKGLGRCLAGVVVRRKERANTKKGRSVVESIRRTQAAPTATD